MIGCRPFGWVHETAMPTNCEMSHDFRRIFTAGASHFLWLCGCGAASPPIEAATPSCSRIYGGCFTACSSVKLSKNTTACGWRNSESRVSTVMMPSAARARMRGARCSRVFRNCPGTETVPIATQQHRTPAKRENAKPAQTKENEMHPTCLQ